MVLSVPVIALGATLGTATSILALCGVTCLCRHMHPKKGLLPRDREPDPEKAKPGVLPSAQQVSVGQVWWPGHLTLCQTRRGTADLQQGSRWPGRMGEGLEGEWGMKAWKGWERNEGGGTTVYREERL